MFVRRHSNSVGLPTELHYLSHATLTGGRAEVVPKHAMKVYGKVKVELQSFLTSALDGVSGQLHATAALIRRKAPLVLRA